MRKWRDAMTSLLACIIDFTVCIKDHFSNGKSAIIFGITIRRWHSHRKSQIFLFPLRKPIWMAVEVKDTRLDWCKGPSKRCAYLYDYIAICFVLIFIEARLYNCTGKNIVKHLFQAPLHQYLNTMYLKPKTFKWIYNKNAKHEWIPNLFWDQNIYLFQSIKQYFFVRI